VSIAPHYIADARAFPVDACRSSLPFIPMMKPLSRFGLSPQLGVVSAIFVLIRLFYLDFVPMWDGFIYMAGMLEAMKGPFDLFRFDIYGHPSWLFILIHALPQYFDWSNIYLLNLTSTVFGVVTIWAFDRFLRNIVPDFDGGVGYFFCLSLFGLHPVFISNSLNVNPDFGLLLFFLVFLNGLLSKNKTEALLGSFGLLFTKETGILLYAVATSLYVLVFILRKPTTIDQKKGELSKIKYLGIPFLVFGIYCFTKAFIFHQPLFWTAINKSSVIPGAFLRFNLLNREFLSSLTGIFILNFNWILALVLLVPTVVFLFNWGFGKERPQRSDLIRFTWVLLGANVFLLTRFTNGANVRYFLTLYPLIFCLSFLYLRKYVRKGSHRLKFLGTAAILIFLSNFWSIDPFSRAIFGTFKAGKQVMLKTVSLWEPDRTVYSVDGLVYNLQFTNFHYAMDQLFAGIRPGPRVPLVAPRSAVYEIGDLDGRTFKRTLPSTQSFVPNFVQARKLIKARNKPEMIYFLEFPNYNNRPYLGNLKRFYRPEEKRTFEWRGYEIGVQKLRLRKRANGKG